jgi:hypothetical protein
VEDLNLGQIKEELKFYEQKRQYSAFNVDVAVELLSQDNCSVRSIELHTLPDILSILLSVQVDKGVLKSKIPTPSVERTEKPTTKLTTMQNGAVINRYVWDDIAKGTLRYPLKCINEIDDEKPPVVEVRTKNFVRRNFTFSMPNLMQFLTQYFSKLNRDLVLILLLLLVFEPMRAMCR